MPTPRKDQSKEEFIQAFMSNDAMVEKYPDEKQRYAVALSEWKMKHNGLTEIHTNMSQLVRKELVDDEEFLVAPAVLIKEGVLNGVLYQAEDIAQATAHWNGMPVVIDHPVEGGKPVSANSPKYAGKVVGRVFNANFDAGKLKAEIWLSVKKAGRHAQEVLTKLTNNMMVELSTGLFTDDVYKTGEYNGRSYDVIAHNHRPDHLALLPFGIGACSIADGAGFPRINAQHTGDEQMPEITFDTKAAYDAEVKKAVDAALADAIKANEAKLAELSTAHEGQVASAVAEALKANAAEVTFKTKADFDREIEVRVNAQIEKHAHEAAVAGLKANKDAVQLPDAALAAMTAEQVSAYAAGFKAAPSFEGKPAPKANESAKTFVPCPEFKF